MNVSSSDITVEAAYSYLQSLVFSLPRSENISYPSATVYSNEATYDVGDIVSYENNYYQCIVAITVAEEWNSAHWN